MRESRVVLGGNLGAAEARGQTAQRRALSTAAFIRATQPGTTRR